MNTRSLVFNGDYAEVYWQGYIDAKVNGAEKKDCPYISTAFIQAWLEGFIAAKDAIGSLKR